MSKENPQDLFGQSIDVGNVVVAARGHALEFYKVTKLTPKMVRIVKFGANTSYEKKGILRYANQLLKVDDQMATFIMLKFEQSEKQL